MDESLETTRRGFLRTLAGGGAGLGLIGTGVTSCTRTEEAEASDTPEASAPGPLLPAVPRRKLGSTGETVPILLLGCAQKFDPTYDKLLHRAYKEGVDYLDTALSYAGGQSHRTIAPFLKQIGDRKKIWVTSKGGVPVNSPQSIQTLIERCLAGLETDYLDMFFMHGANSVNLLERPFIAVAESMKKAGKIRFFGFSCHDGNVPQMLNRGAEAGGIDVIMFRYNFTQYGDLKLNQAIDKCKKAGIGLIAMKTQASVSKEKEEVVQFQSKHFNLAQAKLKAVWSDPRIDAAVSHMDNTKKLGENVAAAKSPVELSMAEFQQLQLLARELAPYRCQGCSHLCEPLLDRPVEVASTLRYLMYHEGYGQTEEARELYGRLAPEARDLDGLDFSRAAAACPQGIDIEARLRQARQELGGGLA
jgi:uncharacterized protein